MGGSNFGCCEEVQQEIDINALRNALNALIDIRRTNLGCEVQLPLFYPDGGSVTVTIVVEKGEYIIHDSGSSVMLLNSNGVGLTKKLSQRINDLVEMYGCEFSMGRVERRCSVEDVAVCAAIVANASRTVGDQLIQKQVIPILDFRAQVLGAVKEIVGSKRYRENEEIYGQSGYSYHVSAVILNENASEPVGFVEPIKDHESATKKFREFWDISRSERFGSVARISLFDDSRHWDSSDLVILQEVSNLVRLSDAKVRMRDFVQAA